MSASETFVIAPDFQFCEICEKSYPDNEFVHVLVSNDSDCAVQYRRYSMCTGCREKCRVDKEYENYVTNKVFKLKLGLLVKIKEK